MNMKNPLVVSLSLLLFTGCSLFSSSKEEAPKPVELGPSTSIDTPEAQLFNEARKFYEANLFAQSQTAFQELKDGYPFGPYAEYAELKVGDTNFYRGDYLTASMIYSEFTKQHPSSDNVPYAMLQLGRSYNLQYSGRGRDMEPLQKSRETLVDLIKKYPHSIYLSAAKKYLSETERKLISHEKLVAEYYKDKGFKKAALARMTRADELKNEFSKVSTDLNVKTKDSSNLDVTAPVSVPKLYTGKYVTPQGLPEVSKVIEASLRVTRVMCNTKAQAINLHINKVLTDPEVQQVENSVKFNEGSVSFTLPSAWANPAEISCLEEQDLLVKENGTFSIKTTKAPTFFSLSSPARLVVAFN
jgi:outer membrane protein assembly factor BamD